MGIVVKTDERILRFISTKLKNKVFDKAMPAVTYLNDDGKIYIMLVFILLLKNSSILLGYAVLSSLSTGCLLGEVIIKPIAKRKRPANAPESHKIPAHKPFLYSFPSGHAMSSFSVAAVLWHYGCCYKYMFLIIALLISFSRIYLFAHYPSDVIAGAVLGTLCGRYTVLAASKYLSKGLLSNANDLRDTILFAIVLYFMIITLANIKQIDHRHLRAYK